MHTTPDFSKQAPRGARVPGGSQARKAARPTSGTLTQRPEPAERTHPPDESQHDPTRYGAGF
jgi:hypothetical protein